MDTFSIAPTLSPTAAGPQGPLAGGPGAADTAPAGQSFGGIFSSLQPGAGRQDLAAFLEAGLPMPALVSQPLGEAMAVITADSPMPGQDSLLAFARSQGLDEAAIAALWHNPSPAATAAPGAANAVATLAAPLQAAAPVPVVALNLPAWANAPLPASPPTDGAPAALNLGGALPVLGQPTPAPASPQTPQTPATASTTTPTPPPVVVLGLSVSGPLPGAEPTAAPAPAPEIDALALQHMRASLLPTGARGAARPQPMPQGDTSAAAAAGLPRSAQEVPTLTLDLQADLAELGRLAEAAPQALPEAAAPGAPAPATSTGTPAAPAPGQTPASAQGNAQAPAPQPVISGYQLKAEHYQQLADRMGQALAQRLQAQIESGQWSMKLRLNPAELGQIDVQLDMHAGGLDARFQTDNAMTRDLLLQGSGRLKDSLNQHGTTVASVWVNSDERRQSGGNPTPQQQQRRASPQTSESRSEAVAPAPATHNRRPDGWDMLA